MGKRVRISNDSLNCYGTRVLTSGLDVEQYRRNPVLLYMHERGQVIGYVKDLEVKDNEVTGELVFDEVTDLSRRCKQQWEKGSLRMVSAGLDILATSNEADLMLPGQTRATITRSKLFEVSVVDIGANDDALRLHIDGKRITFGRDEECPLPLLNTKNKNVKEMDTKTIALQLGLPETASEAEITARLAELKTAREENERMSKECEGLRLSAVETVVDTAIAEKRITQDRRQEFLDLGKEVGKEKLKSVLGAIPPRVKLSAVVGHQGGAPSDTPVAYKKLSEVPADRLLELRRDNPAEYCRLYKEEYGMECSLEE